MTQVGPQSWTMLLFLAAREFASLARGGVRTVLELNLDRYILEAFPFPVLDDTSTTIPGANHNLVQAFTLTAQHVSSLVKAQGLRRLSAR